MNTPPQHKSTGNFCRQVLERTRNIPGVEDVALLDWLPLLETAQYASPGFTMVGQSVSTAAEKPSVLRQAVSSGYFRLIGIPVLRGRGVTEQDTESNAWVVVINEALARRFWQNEDPIGRTIKFDDSPEEKPRQIVGIVGNVKQFALTEDPQPEAYIDYRQVPVRIHSGWTEARVHKSLIIRTHSASKALMQDVRRTISELAPRVSCLRNHNGRADGLEVGDSMALSLPGIEALCRNRADSCPDWNLRGDFALRRRAHS
jgi:hypothetical protein